MSRCAIYCPADLDYFGGLDLGWTKQLRLALVYPDEATAWRTLRDWRKVSNVPSMRLIPVHWRIRNAEGDRVCDRGSIAECRTLLSTYVDKNLPGWSSGPYRIMRVATVPNSEEMKGGNG